MSVLCAVLFRPGACRSVLTLKCCDLKNVQCFRVPFLPVTSAWLCCGVTSASRFPFRSGLHSRSGAASTSSVTTLFVRPSVLPSVLGGIRLEGLDRLRVTLKVQVEHLSIRHNGSQPPAETLKKIADALGVTPDFLIYGTSGEKAKTKLKDADLIQQFQAIESMDEEDKNVVKKLIDAFITKKQLQKLVQ